MEIYVDGHRTEIAPTQTVRELLATLRGEGGDRIVVSLRLDGQDVEADAISSLRQASLSGPGTLELRTESARRLAAHTLGHVRELLSQTQQQHIAVADFLAAGKNAKAMELLTTCFTVWDTAEQSLSKASRLVGVKLDGPDAPPLASDMIRRLRDCLQDIRRALELRDFVAVSDLVEYQLAKIGTDWQKMLADFQQRLLSQP